MSELQRYQTEIVRKRDVMPWCPVCKNEYREGFSMCSECKIPLVDELTKESSFLLLCYIEKKDVKLEEDLKKMLKFSEIPYETRENNNNAEFFIEKKLMHKGKTALKAFTNVNSEYYIKENIDTTLYIGQKESYDTEISDEEYGIVEDHEKLEFSKRQICSGSQLYESKRDKADEEYNSGIIFTLFGFFGIVFMLFNVFDVINLINGKFSLILDTALFVLMLAIGIISFSRAKRFKKDAVSEDSFVDELSEWCTANILKENVIANDEPEEAEEINFFNRISYIKECVKEEYPDIDDTFLDSYSEEFYNEMFE